MDFNSELAEIAKNLKGSDPEFFSRVWSGDLEKYRQRIEAIGLKGCGKVLDAGFGMGQWLIKLAECNKQVYGIEFSADRVKAVQKILNVKGVPNAEIKQGSIEALPYIDSEFEAVFCYGVIFCTDYRKSLREFCRVLKPGGKLYFSANDLGWFLFCLLEEHNKTGNYDPRKMAIDTITDSIDYYCGNSPVPGHQLIIKREQVKQELVELGFSNIIIESEGFINFENPGVSHSFYKHSNYQNQGFIFEVYAVKN